MLRSPLLWVALAAVLGSTPAFAVDRCELNGESVNPNNGNTTQGKTGLMRCRDGDGGQVVREQELKGGVFMGVVRYFKDGALEREYRVNERGNRDGLAREFARSEGGAKPVVVREETYRNGDTVGLARSWYPSGTLKRVSFHGDDGRAIAAAEFTTQGKLSRLDCGPRPLLGADADDARWCGHAGRPAEVVLYNSKGDAKAKLVYERGEHRRSEVLDNGGVVREQRETNEGGGIERVFYESGTKWREVRWVTLAGARGQRVTTLDQEYHESGKLVRERRWRSGERGAELVTEERWYLNGQPRERTEFTVADGRTLRRAVSFHDNGKKSFEGAWLLPAGGGRGGEIPTGVHRSVAANGTLNTERIHDERGRITRERDFDGAGALIRDDEVFEDGSRKASSKP